MTALVMANARKEARRRGNRRPGPTERAREAERLNAEAMKQDSSQGHHGQTRWAPPIRGTSFSSACGDAGTISQHTHTPPSHPPKEKKKKPLIKEQFLVLLHCRIVFLLVDIQFSVARAKSLLHLTCCSPCPSQESASALRLIMRNAHHL